MPHPQTTGRVLLTCSCRTLVHWIAVPLLLRADRGSVAKAAGDAAVASAAGGKGSNWADVTGLVILVAACHRRETDYMRAHPEWLSSQNMGVDTREYTTVAAGGSNSVCAAACTVMNKGVAKAQPQNTIGKRQFQCAAADHGLTSKARVASTLILRHGIMWCPLADWARLRRPDALLNAASAGRGFVPEGTRLAILKCAAF